MEAQRPMFESIIRDDGQKGLKSQGNLLRLTESFVNPASQQLSCSRVGMFIVVGVLFPVSLVLQAIGFNLGQAWTSFVALAGTLAGVYGLNSAAPVWREGNRSDDVAGE